MSISWTLLDIINNDLLGPVWQSLICYCCRRRGRRGRRRRRSSFRPCLPLLSGFSNLFHGFPFVILYWFHFV